MNENTPKYEFPMVQPPQYTAAMMKKLLFQWLGFMVLAIAAVAYVLLEFPTPVPTFLIWWCAGGIVFFALIAAYLLYAALDLSRYYASTLLLDQTGVHRIQNDHEVEAFRWDQISAIYINKAHAPANADFIIFTAQKVNHPGKGLFRIQYSLGRKRNKNILLCTSYSTEREAALRQLAETKLEFVYTAAVG